MPDISSADYFAAADAIDFRQDAAAMPAIATFFFDASRQMAWLAYR
jgi:hypothetical protein